MDKEYTFKITVNAGTGSSGEKYEFIFSGPKGAPIGVVYDACFAVLNDITKAISKHTESVAPKSPGND